jgi:hypothetical protein
LARAKKQSGQSTSKLIKGVADVIISRNKGLGSYVVTRALQQRLIVSPVKLQAKMKEQLSSAQTDGTFYSDSLVQISSE